MNDLTKTALNAREIKTLGSLGVGLFVDNKTGETYVQKRYWNNLPEHRRAHLCKVLSATDEKPEAASYECNDIGNKDRFVRQHGNKVCFLQETREWAVWDGSRWKADAIAKAYALAEATSKSIYDEAKECPDSGGRRKLAHWAERSRSKATLVNMLDLASKALAVSINDFDTSPDEINCKNGVVNLRTGVLTKHDPEQKVMKLAAVTYNPAAQCPTWIKFLDAVFESDEHMIGWIQRALGYSLTGSVDEQCFFALYGTGANGKTTLASVPERILGDYALSTQFEMFLAKDKTNVRSLAAVGELRGRRFAIASETNGGMWDEAAMKRITGGDTLIGATLNNPAFRFPPTHKLWFLANRLPSFRDGSHGFDRRLRVVPFNARFEGDKIDRQLSQKLWAEREGIFAWLVEGAKAYFKSGLDDTPDACLKATDDYIEENNPLRAFIAECMIKDANATVQSEDAYTHYERWCHEQGEIACSRNYFPANMKERGIVSKKTNKGRVFLGYRLRAANEREQTVPVNDNWIDKGNGLSVYEPPKQPDLGEWLEQQQSKGDWRVKAEAVEGLDLDDIDRMYGRRGR